MKAELRKVMDEAAQEFEKYGNIKAARAAKTIKSICWGFSDCEYCPFFIDNKSKYNSDCMLLVPVHWILSQEVKNEE